MSSGNIDAAWQALQNLHSEHCGCTRCVHLMRTAIFGLATELELTRDALRDLRNASAPENADESGVRVHCIADWGNAQGEERRMIYLDLHPAGSAEMLRVGITAHSWGVLSAQVYEALDQMDEIAARERANKNRSN